MSILMFLAPVAVCMGLVGLGAFLWSLRSGQYDDLKGAAYRILIDDDDAEDADDADDRGGKT